MPGFGKDGKGTILYHRDSLALGALAASDLIEGMEYAPTMEDFRLLKAEIYAYVGGLTAGEGAGLLFGLADHGLLDSEIEAALEAAAVAPNDPELEKCHRPVWPIGLLHAEDPAATARFLSKQGPAIWNARWTFGADPDNVGVGGWTYWVYNMGSGALTTGSTVQLLAKYFGVWVK